MTLVSRHFSLKELFGGHHDQRVALLSDIHANWPALQAVLAVLEEERIRTIWLMGDVLGRGSFPSEVLGWVNGTFTKKSQNIIIRGNHDEWVLGTQGDKWKEEANPIFIKSDTMQHSELDGQPGFPGVIGELRDFHELNNGYKRSISMGHESVPDGSKEYKYPWKIAAYESSFKWLAENRPGQGPWVLCLGHTHIPALVSRTLDSGEMHSEKVTPFKEYGIDPEHDWAINPGSVGYPQDLDIRASFGILDLGKATYKLMKVDYPHNEVEDSILKKKYPRDIITHLRNANLPSTTPTDWYEHYQKCRTIKE
jgi:predicted phosphodiesterase